MKIELQNTANDRIINLAKELFRIQITRAMEGVSGHHVTRSPSWESMSADGKHTYCEMAMAAQAEFGKK